MLNEKISKEIEKIICSHDILRARKIRARRKALRPDLISRVTPMFCFDTLSILVYDISCLSCRTGFLSGN